MPSILTVPKAAALLGHNYQTVRKWVLTNPTWHACISHRVGNRIYLSVVKLQRAGLLIVTESPEPVLAYADKE